MYLYICKFLFISIYLSIYIYVKTCISMAFCFYLSIYLYKHKCFLNLHALMLISKREIYQFVF